MYSFQLGEAFYLAQSNVQVHEVTVGNLLRQARAAAKYSSAPHLKIPPARGFEEHSVSVLQELGYTAEEIEKLIANQIITEY